MEIEQQNTTEQDLSLGEIGKLTPAMQEAQAQKNILNMLFKQAQFYSKSTIVPKEYQGNSSNCFIAIQMAKRMNADPFQVMQSLNIIQGRPAWSSQFIISAINTCGRFKTPLNYRITGSWKDHNLTCIAYATSKDGTLCESIPVNWEMANSEGWIAKNGSKWKTMPELMIRYRAASFFGKQFCPEILMGLQSVEEQFDVIEANDNDYTIKDSKEAAKAVEEAISTEKLNLTFNDVKIDSSGVATPSKPEPVILQKVDEKPQEQNKAIEENELNFGYED